MKKEVLIFFGEMGSGKNYWGEHYSNKFNCTFFDGDSIVPPKMAEKVSNFKPLTRELIQDYVGILANAIVDRAVEKNQDLIVAQALYSNEDRKFIAEYLCCFGYAVIFYWVRPSFWRNLKQIYSRKNGLRWVFYWLMNKPFFQKPTHQHYILY